MRTSFVKRRATAFVSEVNKLRSPSKNFINSIRVITVRGAEQIENVGVIGVKSGDWPEASGTFGVTSEPSGQIIGAPIVCYEIGG